MNESNTSRHKAKSALSLLLTAALLLGMIPASIPSARAADTETSKTYTQNMSGATSIQAATSGGSADIVTVSNQTSGFLSGNALLITNTTKNDFRIKLTDFADLQDGVYEISFQTGDKSPGNLGFLARYNGEDKYAGISIDGVLSGWEAHHSNGGNADGQYTRINTVFKAALDPEPLRPNTAYVVKLKFEGNNVTLSYKMEGDREFTLVGTNTQAVYTGTGGLAIRLSPGSELSYDNGGYSAGGGNTILLDNITQKNLDETQVIKVMDFDGPDASVPAFSVLKNKFNNEVVAEGSVTMSLVNVSDASGEAVPGFSDKEQVNRLTSTSSGLFFDSASPVTDNGTYSVKLNGNTSNYGLVFNYTDADNYATIEYDGAKWVAGGKINGTNVTGSTLSGVGHVCTADNTYSMSLTYSADSALKLSFKGVSTKDVTYTLGTLDTLGLYQGAGKAGFIAGANTTLYAGPVNLTYTPPAGAELPPVLLQPGDDQYDQNLSGNTSSFLLADGSNAPAVYVNQAYWGMDGYATTLSAFGNDIHVIFNDFEDVAEGAYVLTFRTGSTPPSNSLGFLARYKDETNFTGISIDSGGSNWVSHYSRGSTRDNTAFANQPGALAADTTYKVKLVYTNTNVSAYVQTEGSDFVHVGTNPLTGAFSKESGKFAIRIRDGVITLDNIIQYSDTAATTEVKRLDFNDGVKPNVSACENKSSTIIAVPSDQFAFVTIPDSETVPEFTPGKASKLTADGASVFLDASSPATDAGVYTVELNGSSNKYGIVFNYADAGNYATIEYDGAKWVAGGMMGGSPVSPIDLSAYNLPALEKDKSYTLRLDARDSANIKLLVSASALDPYVERNLGALTGIYTGEGQVGVTAAEAMTLYAGATQVVYPLTAVAVPDPAEDKRIIIGSADMKVLVGNTFPHVYTYKAADGKTSIANGVRPGAENTDMYIVTELGKDPVLCSTTSELVTADPITDTATYRITATGDGVQAVFTVKLSVEGRVLTMTVPSVEQITGNVRTFAFADGKMVSLAGLGAGAAMSRVNGWGPASDEFIELKGAAKNATYRSLTYALLYDRGSERVAAIENNAENGKDKYILTQNTGAGADAYLALSNTSWPWQYYDEIDPMGEEKPYARVVIGGDENQDSEITWQDAGIAYREIMRKPFGYENTKNEWMFIAMNMSSQASQPFVRVLDEAKAISYLTDGFGMKIMNKGYQAGGHDDSHGDYKFVGIQQGGAEDFNYLINEGLKYGIKNGVHLNMTEYALDGFTTVLENMQTGAYGLNRNWNWFDQAYLVDKSKDVTTGALKERLDDFKATVPGLDFIYVDVYQAGSFYNATQAMKYMNANGWTVGTEALGDFNQGITFVHWNTDLYYGSGAGQSQVMRFIVHGLGDLNAPDRALLGALMPGVADWRNTNMFNDGATTFYRNNLPTKYLQHFDLLSWIPNESAVFSGGVESTVSVEGGKTYTSITKNGKLIAKIDMTDTPLYEDYTGGTPVRPNSAEIFIPWSPEVEDKIYCYSDNGGAQTWDLPATWSDVTTAYLYTLTVNGRDTMLPVTPSGGKVTLNLTAGQPYILVKAQAAMPHLYTADGQATGNTIPEPTGEHAWGEGSLIKNFGFTGQTLEGWTVDTNVADGIAIDMTRIGINNAGLSGAPSGDPQVVFESAATGSLSQTVTVESGKTYSFSVWVNSEGNRPVTLTVTAGDVTKSYSIDTTAGIPIAIKPSKYMHMNWQRLKVDVTVPAGVTAASLSLSTVAGDAPVYADDFRCWEWPNNAQPNPLTNEYYYYEDFENLDENWGPFISKVNNQPFVNLAYKNPDGTQVKYYTVDTVDENGNPDTGNLTSLKGQQNGSFGTVDGMGGIIMRTLPSTLKFETRAKYIVQFDHQTYLEYQGTDGYPAGKNAPLVDRTDLTTSKPAFYVDVRSANGTLIETHPLTPSTFSEEYLAYLESAPANELGRYNERPSTETISFEVDATTESGIFLTFRIDTDMNTADKNEPHSVFAIDNFRVINASDDGQLVSAAKTAVAQGNYDVSQAELNTEEAALAHVQAVLAGLELNGVTADLTPGAFTPAVAGTADAPDGVNGTYTFTVTLTKGSVSDSVTHTMTIRATAFIPDPALAAAKATVESTAYTTSQAEAGDEAAALAKAQALVNALTLGDGVTAAVNTVNYTAAVAGTAENVNGTDGAYVFTVTLTKGEEYVSTKQLTMTITASAYQPTPGSPLDAAKAVVEAATYAAAQSEVGTEAAALAKAQALVNALALGDGVTATVSTVNYTAAVAGTAGAPNGTNGAYVFTVTLSNGTESVTTAALTMTISATVYTDSGSSGGGGSSGSDTTTSTTTNPDGSKTTTVTDKTTGTVTETTTAPNGVKGETVTKKDGSVSASATLPKELEGPVTLPVKDLPVGTTVAITSEAPATVVIPLKDNKPGTVAYLVKPDGSREILRKSVTDGDGLTLHLDGSATVVLADNSKSFADMPAGHWAADAVAFATSRELFLGVGNDTFAPTLPMTRAMFATVLYRLENTPKASAPSFGDVPSGTWYSEAVGWASEKGIVTGTGAGFNPDGEISRESLAVMLYRYAGSPDVSGISLGEFPDAGQVSGWAEDAILWATANGIITGKSGGALDPSGSASRAEVATMLLRFVAKL